ncbi:polysaccharide biosynthesis tyrosine autokinase [Leptolyngbya sp. KIOST-1]|uniref:polysaccharide biosynthesis tyrosine autokinase n=1 Tax=Leptolyngbya sp. KIOST-1 TaxID=1229172 RepID=UPI000564526E|nr:polysaccharide biosynthesis tyrosine autokinase [Leptolyngbya sp. KIOST-1]
MTQNLDITANSPPAAPASPPALEGDPGSTVGIVLGVVRRKLWLMLALGLVASALSVVKNAQVVPVYQSSFRLLVEPVREQRNLSRLTDTQQGTKPQELDYITQVEVLLSPETLTPILAEAQKRYPEATYDGVIGQLNVYRLGETKILEVQYTNSNPEKVKAVLEAIAQGYLKYSLESQRSQLLQGIAFVDERLPLIENRVNSLHQEIQDLQQNYQFLEPDDFANELFKQTAQIDQTRQGLRDEFIALESQYNALLDQASVSAALRQSEAYETLRQEYQVLRQQLAVESARFGPNSPTIQLIQRQQSNLAPLLFEEAERVIQGQIAQLTDAMEVISAQDQELARRENALQQQLQAVPSVSRRYQELQRELLLATNSLTRFRETKEVLQIQASQNEIPWELITPPANARRKPGTSPVKSLVSGFLMGAVLGLALGYLIEKLANTYYTLDDLKKRVPLPILGAIPLHPELIDAAPDAHVVDLRAGPAATSLSADAEALKTQLKTMISPKLSNWQDYVLQAKTTNPAALAIGDPASNGQDTSDQGTNGHQPVAPEANSPAERWLMEYDSYGFLEAFRALNANLGTFSLRSLVITSALPGEGATTVAVHLVQAAAAMERKVLLVDGQFRRGGTRLSSLLGIGSEPGLSNYINGTATLNDITQRLSWEANLFAISSGTAALDPTRLLSSSRMKDLMARMEKNFDLVVYTMPPLMGLADVGLVAAKTDGVLLVTSLGRRNIADALKRTLERMQIARVPVVGLVVNKVKNYEVDFYAKSA